MNRVELSGRLVSDPQLKHVGTKGTHLVSFAIAQNMGEGDYKKAHYFDCKAWSSVADSVVNNFRKGDLIELRGMLNQETWTATDGQKRSKIVVVVMECRVPDYGNNAQAPQTRPASKPQEPAPKNVPEPGDIDVPFNVAVL